MHTWNKLAPNNILILDTHLNLEEHPKTVVTKVTKIMGLIQKLRDYLPIPSLLTPNKSFVRLHLDCEDIIIDQPKFAPKQNRKYTIQQEPCYYWCNKRNFKRKTHIELGLESFQHSRWYRKHFCFYNTTVNKSPIYLAKLFPSNNTIYNIRNNNKITLMNFKQNFFRIFFPINHNSVEYT